MPGADNSTEDSFLKQEEVGKSCEEDSEDRPEGTYIPIRERFDTLLAERGMKWVNAYSSKEMGELHKSTASKIRNGLLIPPHWQRIRIARFFSVDSATIWRASDLPYIRKILEEQKKEAKKND